MIQLRLGFDHQGEDKTQNIQLTAHFAVSGMRKINEFLQLLDYAIGQLLNAWRPLAGGHHINSILIPIPCFVNYKVEILY